MVCLEVLVNNTRRKVYGRPVDIEPTCIYYCDVEEDVFTGVGDCIILHSDHTVLQGDRVYTTIEAKSILPIWMVAISILPGDFPIRYTALFFPHNLKVNLSTQRLENQAGLVFNE